MNDPKDFLTRWSRRKRRAADEAASPAADEREQRTADAPSAARDADAVTPPSVQAAEAPTTEPVFDLSKLPTLESITAETDIRAFLAPGVPAELRLAALRRAWVADPKVRDFVGLADYDFDFHTPGAIPGFGPLEMTDELRREVARIVGAWQAEPEPAPGALTEPTADPGIPAGQPAVGIGETETSSSSDEPTTSEEAGARTGQVAGDQDEVIADKAKIQGGEDHAASQQQHSKSENLQTLASRVHGRALPK
jgi:hypothetical protein